MPTSSCTVVPWSAAMVPVVSPRSMTCSLRATACAGAAGWACCGAACWVCCCGAGSGCAAAPGRLGLGRLLRRRLGLRRGGLGLGGGRAARGEAGLDRAPSGTERHGLGTQIVEALISDLANDHAWKSNPWSWTVQWRPTLFYAEW
ncbi:hypothetical protein, partial [Serinicoccus sp. CNJ-927]|uniref:hypothetical protein n=1 Tax=Serinicoccus sp. CNJ-927 TaxID=1904970 RepID=UPI001EDB1B44